MSRSHVRCWVWWYAFAIPELGRQTSSLPSQVTQPTWWAPGQTESTFEISLWFYIINTHMHLNAYIPVFTQGSEWRYTPTNMYRSIQEPPKQNHPWRASCASQLQNQEYPGHCLSSSAVWACARYWAPLTPGSLISSRNAVLTPFLPKLMLGLQNNVYKVWAHVFMQVVPWMFKQG